MSDSLGSVARLRTPLTDDSILALTAGDRVLLSGVVYGARDAAHKRLVEALQGGTELPMPLAGQVVYYVGPAPGRPGSIIGPAGPTTASRMDPYAPALLARGLKGVIGKGRCGPHVRRALQTHTAVYFVAVGGAAALLAQRIKRAEVIGYADLGPEAIWQLEVEDFPVVVANDVHGQDLFEIGQDTYRRREFTV